MSEKQAIIVIPVYTTQLTVSEHAALRQCFDILSSYPKCFVKPESLDITSLVRDYPANHIVPFPDTYFKGIAGYNRLMIDRKSDVARVLRNLRPMGIYTHLSNRRMGIFRSSIRMVFQRIRLHRGSVDTQA